MASFEIIDDSEQGQTWLRITLDADQVRDVEDGLRRQLLYMLRCVAKRELRQMRHGGAILSQEAIHFLRRPSL